MTDAVTDVEAEPAAAERLLGDGIGRARLFTADLAERGERLGLIGPLEPPRLWTRHVLNSALVAPLLSEDSAVADVGTGAGLPGLVLAIARPDVRMTLIEPMERRVEWLLEQTERLGLRNVTVIRARAEDARDAGPFDQVTARAVSALRTLLPLVVPLVRSGGEVVLLKGASVRAEVDAAEKVMRRLRLQDARVDVLGFGLLSEETRVFRASVP